MSDESSQRSKQTSRLLGFSVSGLAGTILGFVINSGELALAGMLTLATAALYAFIAPNIGVTADE